MSKQLLPKDKGNERTTSWARYQLTVTKHKDDEIVSSSPYAMWDSFNPVTDFTKFYEDDEDIKDQVMILLPIQLSTDALFIDLFQLS